jgi:hypothetical protein
LICANRPFDPRAASSQRLPPYKELLCLTGMPPISHIADLLVRRNYKANVRPAKHASIPDVEEKTAHKLGG